MGEALTIEVRHEQGCAILTVAGEIDISTVTPMRERLFEVAASGAPLVVDLEQVSFIDSVGIAVLVGAAKRAAMHGGTLQVACALPKIRQLVRLTRVVSEPAESQRKSVTPTAPQRQQQRRWPEISRWSNQMFLPESSER